MNRYRSMGNIQDYCGHDSQMHYIDFVRRLLQLHGRAVPNGRPKFGHRDNRLDFPYRWYCCTTDSFAGIYIMNYRLYYVINLTYINI